ncbi:MAG: bacteriohemerythrin [Betaproteobacteria bacterium]|nr:bacteriohemerythrin [Betaproteobacteria bacterium]
MPNRIGQKIAWRDEFSIGIPAIDDQHKQLLDLLNQLNSFDHGQNGQNAQPNRLVKMLDSLSEYAAHHFVQEEALMRDHLPVSDKTTDHIVAHRSYWTIIVALKNRLLKGDAKVNAELVEYLNHWWINHILKIDQDMGRELKLRGVA